MIKVVHMGSAHSAEDVRIFQKECRTLAEVGYEVVLIVQSNQDAIVDNVRIRPARRARSRLERFTLTLRDMLRLALHEDADIYHLHGPDLLPIGMFLRLRGKKVIYDVHEDFPAEILTKHWIPSSLRRPIASITRMVELLAALAFDRIIAATPTIAWAFPQSKTTIVRNFPRLEEFSAIGQIPYSARPMRAIYAGSITDVRCIREIVQAVGLIPDSYGAQLVLAGKFEPPDLYAEVSALQGWSRVEFVGWKNRQEVNQLLGNARLGLVIFAPTQNHVRAEPNKLFEYMAAGLPVIASNFPYWREIIEPARAGITVDPTSPEQISNAMIWLFENPAEAEQMGRNGAMAIRSIYHWDCEARKLVDVYDAVVNRQLSGANTHS